jgi:GT2 family glycosyltransferase
MNLTIVTITYNGAESTIKLLKSLENQSNQDFNVIVVDNASDDADFAKLQQYVNVSTSDVDTLVKNVDNLGFSGGNNVGIRQALHPSTPEVQEMAPDWILLLNNDTWVERDFMASLRARIGGLEGIVGLPLAEGSRTAYYGIIEWLKSTLNHNYISSDLRGRGPDLVGRIYVIGGAMLIHKDVFKKIGYFDEKYFLYFEDADFSIRARKAGISINILDDPVAHHSLQETTKKLGSPTLLYYHYRNALYFNNKNGAWYIKIANWFWCQWIIKKQLLKIILNIKRDESKAILEGAYDYYINKFGKKD